MGLSLVCKDWLLQTKDKLISCGFYNEFMKESLQWRLKILPREIYSFNFIISMLLDKLDGICGGFSTQNGSSIRVQGTFV